MLEGNQVEGNNKVEGNKVCYRPAGHIGCCFVHCHQDVSFERNEGCGRASICQCALPFLNLRKTHNLSNSMSW